MTPEKVYRDRVQPGRKAHAAGIQVETQSCMILSLGHCLQSMNDMQSLSEAVAACSFIDCKTVMDRRTFFPWIAHHIFVVGDPKGKKSVYPVMIMAQPLTGVYVVHTPVSELAPLA
jgi:hypothetical protein